MDTDHNLPRWIEIDGTAQYLNVSTRTVRRMVARGELRAKRIGPRLLRIDRTSVLELVA